MKEKEASGGNLVAHGVAFFLSMEAITWYNHHRLKISMFADAKALLHCMQLAVRGLARIFHSKSRIPEKVEMDSDLKAAIVASFDGTLPLVLAGNKTKLEGGTYDCLYAYQKNYAKWNPLGKARA
jgi:hypothetical protein